MSFIFTFLDKYLAHKTTKSVTKKSVSTKTGIVRSGLLRIGDWPEKCNRCTPSEKLKGVDTLEGTSYVPGFPPQKDKAFPNSLAITC